jgi:hypothetical protein
MGLFMALTPSSEGGKPAPQGYAYLDGHAPTIKSFLLLFFKKEGLASFLA